MAAPQLAELFAAPPSSVARWTSSANDGGDSNAFADLLLQDSEHQRFLRLQFYRDGWFKPFQPSPQLNEGDDRVLQDIKYNLEVAARDYVEEVRSLPAL